MTTTKNLTKQFYDILNEQVKIAKENNQILSITDIRAKIKPEVLSLGSLEGIIDFDIYVIPEGYIVQDLPGFAGALLEYNKSKNPEIIICEACKKLGEEVFEYFILHEAGHILTASNFGQDEFLYGGYFTFQNRNIEKALENCKNYILENNRGWFFKKYIKKEKLFTQFYQPNLVLFEAAADTYASKYSQSDKAIDLLKNLTASEINMENVDENDFYQISKKSIEKDWNLQIAAAIGQAFYYDSMKKTFKRR